MPLQIGCSVFDDTKLRIYEFYYDCVDKYIDRRDFQYIESDTDSAYFIYFIIEIVHEVHKHNE